VFENHTVRDNLLLALAGQRSWYKLLLASPTRPRTLAWRDPVDHPHGGPAAHAGARLSHGQKQWLEIGMLLAQDPKLLLVDEPVAGMTDVETETTAQVLREINKTHSVVVVEHDMSFVRALGVKVTVLHEGSMLAEGTLDQVSADPRVRRSLSRALMMLSVQNVDLYYGAAQALRSVSISAEIGKVTCLLGRNGVGKTSLLRAIVGLQPISAGSISLAGHGGLAAAGLRAGAARRGAGAAGAARSSRC
jgi:ABC-type uncharacterized transport system ATPase subunit